MSREFDLATVFTLPKGDRFKEVTAEYIQHEVNRYNKVDDVFHNAFLATVVLQGRWEGFPITTEARDYLHGLGTKCIICTESDNLLPGPYAVIGGQLRDAWKLIDDINGTCMVTLKPQSK